MLKACDGMIVGGLPSPLKGQVPPVASPNSLDRLPHAAPRPAPSLRWEETADSPVLPLCLAPRSPCTCTPEAEDAPVGHGMPLGLPRLHQTRSPTTGSGRWWCRRPGPQGPLWVPLRATLPACLPDRSSTSAGPPVKRWLPGTRRRGTGRR